MAIRQRIKADTAEQANAKARWREYKQESFNQDSNLFNFHAGFWENFYPQILSEIEYNDPALAKRLKETVSWDRKMAGIIFYYAGSPICEPVKAETKAPTRRPTVLKLKRKLGAK